MIGMVKQPAKQGLLWYTRTADGKKKFFGTERAEELLRQGCLIMCRCKIGDLRR